VKPAAPVSHQFRPLACLLMLLAFCIAQLAPRCNCSRSPVLPARVGGPFSGSLEIPGQPKISDLLREERLCRPTGRSARSRQFSNRSSCRDVRSWSALSCSPVNLVTSFAESQKKKNSRRRREVRYLQNDVARKEKGKICLGTPLKGGFCWRPLKNCISVERHRKTASVC
jgi:hypothetical protein